MTTLRRLARSDVHINLLSTASDADDEEFSKLLKSSNVIVEILYETVADSKLLTDA
jgi:hypothetical protein